MRKERKKYNGKLHLKVHVRVASPPVRHPCFMGINIPTKEELLINKIPKRELAKHLSADSVEYLSVQGLLRAVETRWKGRVDGDGDAEGGGGCDRVSCGSEGGGGSGAGSGGGGRGDGGSGREEKAVKHGGGRKGSHCTACLTGEYPVHPQALADQF